MLAERLMISRSSSGSCNFLDGGAVTNLPLHRKPGLAIDSLQPPDLDHYRVTTTQRTLAVYEPRFHYKHL